MVSIKIYVLFTTLKDYYNTEIHCMSHNKVSWKWAPALATGKRYMSYTRMTFIHQNYNLLSVRLYDCFETGRTDTAERFICSQPG